MSRMEGNIFLSCKRGTQRIDDYRWFSTCFFYSFPYIQSMPPNGLIKSTFLLRLSQRDRLAIPTFSEVCSNLSTKCTCLLSSLNREYITSLNCVVC